MIRRKEFATSIKKLFFYISISLLALLTLLPLFWMFTGSIKGRLEVMEVPVKWLPFIDFVPHFENYIVIFEKLPFALMMFNSGFVATVLVFSNVFFCSMAGYGFARFKFPGRRIFYLFIIGTMMIPFEAIVIPLYITMHQIGVLDTYIVLMLPFMISAFGIFLIHQFALGIPVDLIDSGRMDGAGEFSIYWKIVMPNLKPALITLLILTFIMSWDSLLWPLMTIQGMELNTVPLGLLWFTQYQGQLVIYNEWMAAGVWSTLPALIAFFLFQKRFVEGMTFSGIKR